MALWHETFGNPPAHQQAGFAFGRAKGGCGSFSMK
ncbi:hypothetical protein I656_00495 [Geobacillus sp. WSUCF1]|nr:hypothetical protein I656_00495 [Geobacillus sp. WSUCF1]GAJ56979.1 hypothetical protein B23_0168 [Geobacillus thermoleovorans B23]